MRILKVVYLIFYKILIANLQENFSQLEGRINNQILGLYWLNPSLKFLSFV